MSTFVLVHGAWHGGWAWSPLKKLLEKNGHCVFSPTMTGLGERSHLISKNISINTVVRDISNTLRYEGLFDVILVGHSFGGAIISGVAEQEPQRIKQLIYLDAAILENSESMFDPMTTELANERRQLAENSSGGVSLPLPTAQQLGIFDESQWSFIRDRLTPHPLSTYNTPLILNNLPGEGFPCLYVACSKPFYRPLEWARERASLYGWPITYIETGHDAMISAPNALYKLLIDNQL